MIYYKERQLDPKELVMTYNAWADDFLDKSKSPDVLSLGVDDASHRTWHDKAYAFAPRQTGRSSVEFVLWDEALWIEATAGAEAFIGCKVDGIVYQRNNQIWHSRLRRVMMEDEMLRSGLRLPAISLFLVVAPCIGDDGRDGVTVMQNYSQMGPVDEGRCILRFYPPLYDGDEIEHDFHANIYAAMKFMALPIVSTPSAIDRAERRRLEVVAKKRREEPPTVVTVTLRHEMLKHVRSTSTRKKGVDFQYRVRGHWRRYTARNGGVPIYIDPYFKGNRDMPVRPSSTTVYRVKK